MLHYFRNPRTEDLIIWDSKENELFIIERIKKIKVFTEEDLLSPMREDKEELAVGRGWASDKKGKRKRKRSPKITPEQIEEIKSLREDGKSLREIGEEMGIAIATVNKYLKKGE